MHLLIDGNNLLHASDLFAEAGVSSQQRLVDFLVAVFGPKAVGEIVFDGRPLGASVPQSSGSLRVLHPSRKQTADDVLESLLENHAAPKQMLVISSDHRIQRAARQHGAKYRDSEEFWKELRRMRHAQHQSPPPAEKPGELSEGEVRAWLEEFGRAEKET